MILLSGSRESRIHGYNIAKHLRREHSGGADRTDLDSFSSTFNSSSFPPFFFSFMTLLALCLFSEDILNEGNLFLPTGWVGS